MTTPSTLRIPFNKPGVIGPEFEYMEDCFKRGIISGDGYYTGQCNERLENITNCGKSLLTTSCTHALEMTALLLNLKPGDEVIVPSYTFVTTVNAFTTRGAVPRFIDSRPDTLNLDESKLEALISPKTKAIVVVHYAGIACEMDTICSIAATHGIPVIEDNAHGLFGSYKGKPLGSLGVMATQSFHETKNIICGEGGALLLNDPSLYERAEIIREKGTNRSRFFRGEVDKYSWVDVGSSYLPSDMLAAFLFAQLENADKIQAKRASIWNAYDAGLKSWSEKLNVRTPVVPDSCEQAYHMYYLRFSDVEKRTAFIAHMKSKGILCVFHYLPLHLTEKGSEWGGKPGDCPVAEQAGECLVRLPMFINLTDDEQQSVIEAATSFTH